MTKIIMIELDGENRYYNIGSGNEEEVKKILQFFRNCICFGIYFENGYHWALEEYCQNLFGDCEEVHIECF